MLSQKSALVGLILFAIFAPHSIAGAEIAAAIVGASWIISTLATRRIGFGRSELDLPIWLLIIWSVLSSIFSAEPAISLPKLQHLWVVVLFYWTQAIVKRRTAILLVAIMILSGVTGTIYSVFDLLRGRGLVVESITADSPLHQASVLVGDTIWRIGRERIYSPVDIDRKIGEAPEGSTLSVSLISRGEHIERKGLVVTSEIKNQSSPSGVTGEKRNHRFRASGWTRHYQTFAEILQILAQLSLGLLLAHFKNHGTNLRFNLALAALVVLIPGIILTSMRSTLVAFAIGAFVIGLQAISGRQRLLLTAVIAAVLGAGAVVVWQTRAPDALLLQDDSATLRGDLARAAANRILVHPLFGHGMDAVKLHWTEWGLPGDEPLHFHSTPLQIAFDRGLPALFFWFWLIAACWLLTYRTTTAAAESGDTNRYGVLLGATGAITGLFASSLVNYNFGDGEVALVFWWLMGIVIVLKRDIEQHK